MRSKWDHLGAALIRKNAKRYIRLGSQTKDLCVNKHQKKMLLLLFFGVQKELFSFTTKSVSIFYLHLLLAEMMSFIVIIFLAAL